MAKKKTVVDNQFQGVSTIEILSKVVSDCRPDYEGQDPDAYIKQWFAEKGVDLGPRTVAHIREMTERRFKGIRKAITPRIDEAIKRFGGPEAEMALRRESAE